MSAWLVAAVVAAQVLTVLAWRAAAADARLARVELAVARVELDVVMSCSGWWRCACGSSLTREQFVDCDGVRHAEDGCQPDRERLP